MSSADKRIPTLASAILDDVILHFKLPLFLLLFIIASSIAVVIVTQETRQLVDQKDKLAAELDYLDVEWRNLILEENTLAEHSRIQDLVSQQLKMKLPDPKDEVVIELQ